MGLLCELSHHPTSLRTILAKASWQGQQEDGRPRSMGGSEGTASQLKGSAAELGTKYGNSPPQDLPSSACQARVAPL